jgi:putative Mg2+ transporter-C (MgtC) family protein
VSADLFTHLQIDLLLSLGLAVVCGGAIGLEREYSQHPAGLRTNILICVGAALIMELSMRVGGPSVNADPGRIAAQVVSGIGFLGAGAIIQSRGAVRGLTTAATIWVVAGIGLAIGAGEQLAAIGSTILVLMVLVVLGHFERRVLHRLRGHTITFRTSKSFRFDSIAHLLSEAGFRVQMRRVTEHSGHRVFRLRLQGAEEQLDDLSDSLLRRDDVESVRR